MRTYCNKMLIGLSNRAENRYLIINMSLYTTLAISVPVRNLMILHAVPECIAKIIWRKKYLKFSKEKKAKIFFRKFGNEIFESRKSHFT